MRLSLFFRGVDLLRCLVSARILLMLDIAKKKERSIHLKLDGPEEYAEKT